MLEQPAGEEGVGRFVHPLIHERSDFFTEIRGMAKPRELEAFQRAHGSVAEILPREIVLVGGHKGLLRARISGTSYYPIYIFNFQYNKCLCLRDVDKWIPPTRGRRSGAANLSSGGQSWQHRFKALTRWRAGGVNGQREHQGEANRPPPQPLRQGEGEVV